MHIAILAFPRFQLLDVAGPADVFAEASRQLGRPDAYQVQVIGSQQGLLASSSGLRLAVDATVATHRGPIDTRLVAGSPDIDDMASDGPVQDCLRLQAGTVRRYGSVFTGAFVLGASGLLDGKRVATHWNSMARLAADYPAACVEADAIYVKEGKLFTSAGVTAGMDLALAMVEDDHGRELALRVARQLVMFLKRPGGQSQFSAHLAAQTAERSGMRERSFARIFRSETGTTPAEFVENARIDAARRLGVSPAEYRRRFAK